jgi:hypothetical protein
MYNCVQCTFNKLYSIDHFYTAWSQLLKGHRYEKSVSNKQIGGCFRPAVWAVTTFKNFLIAHCCNKFILRLLEENSEASSARSGKIGSAAGHRDRKAARTGGKLGLRRATGTVSPPIFRLRSAPPQKRQVSTYKIVLFGGSAACHRPFNPPSP